MMKVRTPIAKLMLIIPLIVLTSTVNAKPLSKPTKITAQPFIKVKTKSSTLKKLCHQHQLTCTEEAGFLWQNKRVKTDYYLIDDSPKLVKLRKHAGNYQAVDSWDFSNYAHHSTGARTHDMPSSGLSIYPALYPLNKKEVSIALLSNYFTGFSGGGANESVADFVMLQPHGRYKVALKNISFDENHMYRACFSEKEYNTSPHCHEEGWRVLRIKFTDVGKPFYQWTLHYTDTVWDAHQEKTAQKKTYERYTKMPFESKTSSNLIKK